MPRTMIYLFFYLTGVSHQTEETTKTVAGIKKGEITQAVPVGNPQPILQV